jgi:tetratricopeptide (TPR) repeat protein
MKKISPISIALALTLLYFFTNFAQAQSLPAGYQFTEFRDTQSGNLTQIVFLDEATIGLQGQNREEIKTLTIAYQPYSKEQALVFAFSEKKKESKLNSFAAAKLFINNKAVDISPCKIFERRKVGKIYLTIAGVQITEKIRNEVLNADSVKAECGDVTIEANKDNLQALHFFGYRLGVSERNLAVAESVEETNADVESVIERSQIYFQEGNAAIKQSDYLSARNKYDRAVSIILESGISLSAYKKLKRYYDQLINQVYEIEVANPELARARPPASEPSVTTTDLPDVTTTNGRPKTVQVDGYYRKDGTYVRPHRRSAPRRRN